MAPWNAFLEDATRETSASRSGPSPMRDGDHMGYTCRYEGCPTLALGGGMLCIIHTKQSQIANSCLPNDILSTNGICPSDSSSALEAPTFSAIHLSNGAKPMPNQDTLNPQRVTMSASQLQESPGTPGKKLSAKKTARKTAQVSQRAHIATGVSQSCTTPGSFINNAPRGEPLAHSVSAQPPLKRQRISGDNNLIHRQYQSTVQTPSINKDILSSSNPNTYPLQSSNGFSVLPGMSAKTGGQNQNHEEVNERPTNRSVPRTDTGGNAPEIISQPQHAQELGESGQSSQWQDRRAGGVDNSTNRIRLPTLVQLSTHSTYEQFRTPNNQSENNFPRITITSRANGVDSPRGFKDLPETNSYQPSLTEENQIHQIPAEKSLPDRAQLPHIHQLQQSHFAPQSIPLDLGSGEPKILSFENKQGFFSAVLNTDDISVTSQNQDMSPYPNPPSLQRSDSPSANAKGFHPSSRSYAQSGGQSTNGFGASSGSHRHEVTSQPPQKRSPWLENWRQRNQIARGPSSKGSGSGLQPRDGSGKLSEQVPLTGNSGSRASNPTASRQQAFMTATPVIIDLVSDDDESSHELKTHQVKKRPAHTVTSPALHAQHSDIPSIHPWSQERSSPGALLVNDNVARSNNNPSDYKHQSLCSSEAPITPYPWAFAAQKLDTNFPGSGEQTIGREGSADKIRGRGDFVSSQVPDGPLVHPQHHNHHHQSPALSSTGDGSGTNRPRPISRIQTQPSPYGSGSTTLPVPEKPVLIEHTATPAFGFFHNHQLPHNNQRKTETEQHGGMRLNAHAEGSKHKIDRRTVPPVNSKVTPAAVQTRSIPTINERRRAHRHGKLTFGRHGESALDKYIYGPANDQNRPGASANSVPSGIMIEKSEQPVEHWAHFDPRVHWTWPRTREWHESKMKEISAKPSRKSRLLLNKSKAGEEHHSAEIPEIVQNNPHWLACIKEFDELAEAGLAHQQSLKGQRKRKAKAVSSRTNTGTIDGSGDDYSDE